MRQTGREVVRTATNAAACTTETPEACFWLDGDSYPVTVTTQELTDPDRLGQPDRPVRVAQYIPLGAPTPLPVVVVSHGGSGDLEIVLDQLENAGNDDLDLDRIAYLGHSAGAGSAMMAAGATRALFEGATPDVYADVRPIAFVGLSPQGTDDDGFADGSWMGIDRPFLTATGLSDGDSESVARGRRDPYDGMPDGDKYRLWIEHPAAKHGLFGGNDDACVGANATEAECAEMGDWVRSAVFAFLDANLLDDAQAVAWLSSNNVAIAGDPVVEWDIK